jgi:hypothetical protein
MYVRYKHYLKGFLFALAALNAVYAYASNNNDQWFIQIGAFQSVNNALDLQEQMQSKLKLRYALERDFAHHVSIHRQGQYYRVLIGPYPSQTAAKTAQNDLPLPDSSAVTKFTVNHYTNYRHNYQFTWHEIDQRIYQDLYQRSLVVLTPKFSQPLLSAKDVSLLEHTYQISEEIFDIAAANKRLIAKNGVLLQDDRSSSIINGYQINGKSVPLTWDFFFYAYYPSEDVVVLMGEGETLIGLETDSGELTNKLPYLTLYQPERKLRITGSDFDAFGYGRAYIEFYQPEQKRYIELIDLAIISPWYKDTAANGIGWLSANEVIFEMLETPYNQNDDYTKRRFYRVKIETVVE